MPEEHELELFSGLAMLSEDPYDVTEEEPNESNEEKPPEETEKPYDVECDGGHEVVSTSVMY